MNQVTLSGQITDVHPHAAQDGSQIARFRLAVLNYRLEFEQYPCIAYGDRAQQILQYSQGGNPVYAEIMASLQERPLTNDPTEKRKTNVLSVNGLGYIGMGVINAQQGLNRGFFCVRLGADPQTRYFESGRAIVSFNGCVNRSRDISDWITFESWGDSDRMKQVETLSQYAKKGSSLAIEGELRLDQWIDKETQQPRQKIKIIISRFNFVGSRSDNPMHLTGQNLTGQTPQWSESSQQPMTVQRPVSPTVPTSQPVAPVGMGSLDAIPF